MTNTQTMIQGDCLNLMREMPEAAFDAWASLFPCWHFPRLYSIPKK